MKAKKAKNLKAVKDLPEVAPKEAVNQNLLLSEPQVYQRVLCLVFGHTTDDGFVTWKDDKGNITLQFRVCKRCAGLYYNAEKVPVGGAK